MNRSKRNKFAWMLATVALPVTSAALTGHANAACAPAIPVDNTTTTCSGTTTDQNAPNGYGINTATGAGITVNVGAGASVTATNGDGITFLSGTVNNDGTINGGGGNGAAGIATGSNATINNSGSIIGSNGANSVGVFVDNSLTMTNTGSIQGVVGIFALRASTITSSGLITGTGGVAVRLSDQNDSVTLLGSSLVVGTVDLRGGNDVLRNDGVILGSFQDNGIQRDVKGVNSSGISTIINSGTISGGNDSQAISGNDVTVTNLAGGTIAGNGNGAAINASTATVSNAGDIFSQGTAGNAIIADTVDVTNSGTIEATGDNGIAINATAGAATVTNLAGGTIKANGADGKAIQATTTATVNNAGLIQSLGTTGNAILAGAVDVTNSGTIEAPGNVAISSSFGDARVNNSGTIFGAAQAIGAAALANVANAAGGFIQAVSITSQSAQTISGFDVLLSNAGTITADGFANGNIAVFAVNNATVQNFGNIQAFGVGSAAILALAGTADVTNLGSISQQGDGGAVILGGEIAKVNNSGSIQTTSANSFAIFAPGNATAGFASVSNGGTISATGAGGVAISAGIPGGNNGSVATVNNLSTGTISADTQAILSNTGLANVTNAGTIETTGAAGGSAIQAFTTATVNNLGTVRSATGFGISAAAVNAINSGTISGNTGIFASGAGGVGSNITNSGTIAGTGGTAIRLSPAADTLTILPGSRIVGLIDMGGGADTININNNIVPVSRVSSLTTLLPVNTILQNIINFTGTLNANTTVNTGNMPSVQTADSVATLDPTGFAQADRALMNFTGGVSSLVQGRLGGRAANGSTVQVMSFSPTGASSRTEEAFAAISAMGYAKEQTRPRAYPFTYADAPYNVWTSGFGGTSTQKGDDTMLRSTASAGAAVIGVDRQVRPDLLIGAFAGGGTGRLSVELNSQSVDTDYATGGVYGRFDWVSHFLDFTLQGGATTNKSKRLVLNGAAPGGSETATASYDSWYISPEIAYGRRYHFANGYTLTPLGRIRYLAGTFDGYNEAGSAQNLVVGRRTMHDLEERAEVELSRITGGGAGSFRTNVHGGLIALQRLGNPTINTVLIGQDLSFTTPGKASSAGVVAGAGFDFRATERMSLFGAVEATLMSDGSRTAAGKAGLMFAF